MINFSKSPRLLKRVAPFALMLMVSANLYAVQATTFSLKGSSQVPEVTTSANGTGEITVLPDHTVSGSIKTSGIDSTMAHIHEAAAGKNGPPIITLTKTTSDSYTVPAGAKLTDEQYKSYMANNLYVNVHSAKYPDGEIRAQLLH